MFSPDRPEIVMNQDGLGTRRHSQGVGPLTRPTLSPDLDESGQSGQSGHFSPDLPEIRRVFSPDRRNRAFVLLNHEDQENQEDWSPDLSKKSTNCRNSPDSPDFSSLVS